MAEACLDQNVGAAIFCEDDVEFLPGFSERIGIVSRYLEMHEWDVFSGLVTDLGHGYRIRRVVAFEGETFVHLNRCVGMVFGAYARKALERLAGWTPDSGVPIDRHLENSEDLEVVTALPFLVGHRDDLTSSVWKFSNARYRNLIRSSERRLFAMVEAFRADGAAS